MGTSPITYAYDAYGKLISTSYKNGGNTIDAVVNNSILYRGYYFDRDLGLYCLISRYYDSNTGRFISPDDVSYLGANGDLSSYNLYAYCSNNPIMYVDPTGHSISAIVAGAIIGFILGATYGGLSAAANEQNVLVGMLIGGTVGAGTAILTEVSSGVVLAVTTFLLGASGDVITQVANSNSFNEINWEQAIWSGAINSFLTIPSKGISKISAELSFNMMENVIAGTMLNSPLLALGTALNIAVSICISSP